MVSRVISWAELVRVSTSPVAIDALVQPEAPLVVVDVTGGDTRSRLALEMGAFPAVLIGVGEGEGWDACDVFVGTDSALLQSLQTAVRRNPLACASLVQLLRGGANRSVSEGLVAESVTYSMLQAGPEHGAWLATRRQGPAARQGPVARQEPASASAERLAAASDLPATAAVEVLPSDLPATAAVEVLRRGDTVAITLARPQVHNAFSAQMRDELYDALAVVIQDPAVRLVLKGEGASFCSGGDLTEFGSCADPATAHTIRMRRNCALAMARCSERTEVVLHGTCAGAGAELAAFAASIRARGDTRIVLPEIGMGLIPGAGGTVSIPRRIGRQRAAQVMLTGESVPVDLALEWGLIDEVLD